MTDQLTPPCVFCGEPTHAFVHNEGGVYSCAVVCSHCDSHGPIVLDGDVEQVKRRAVTAYERGTQVRDRLLVACQRLLDAETEAYDEGNYQGLVEATELARYAVQAFTLSHERRPYATR